MHDRVVWRNQQRGQTETFKGQKTRHHEDWDDADDADDDDEEEEPDEGGDDEDGMDKDEITEVHPREGLENGETASSHKKGNHGKVHQLVSCFVSSNHPIY